MAYLARWRDVCALAVLRGLEIGMSRPYFRPSKCAAYEREMCQDANCIVAGGRKLEGTDFFWNPNPRAKIRHICPVCYARREIEKVAYIESTEPPVWALTNSGR